MPTSTLSRAIAPLVDFVYPPRCPLCGTGIATAPALCGDCWEEMDFLSEPTAISAGTNHEVAAVALYNDAARKLVLRFKHGGRIGLATLMGRLIAARLSDAAPDAILVPVPLHRNRLWMRGYNQAALLVHAIAKHTGHAVMVDALRRTRATPKLGGLGRAARARTLRGAIAIRELHRSQIEGRDVILVDDVLTSGATSAACARVLLEAGALSVRVACFAKVPENRAPERETPEAMKTPGAA